MITSEEVKKIHNKLIEAHGAELVSICNCICMSIFAMTKIYGDQKSSAAATFVATMISSYARGKGYTQTQLVECTKDCQKASETMAQIYASEQTADPLVEILSELAIAKALQR